MRQNIPTLAKICQGKDYCNYKPNEFAKLQLRIAYWPPDPLAPPVAGWLLLVAAGVKLCPPREPNTNHNTTMIIIMIIQKLGFLSMIFP